MDAVRSENGPDVARSGVRVHEAGPEHAAGLSSLFSRAEVPCHCRYWHFTGDTNAWLDRCAHGSERSRAEMASALESGSNEMRGVVALEAHDVVGWLKVAPAAAVPKLYAQRLYRNLPCFAGDRTGVLAIGCLLVDPLRRRRGIAEALVSGAIASARASGARAIEAFPRRAEGVGDAELWTGPFEVFEKAGFAAVHDFAPYPVLRLKL